MGYSNTKREFSLRDLLYRALIFIGTVGVIVYFLPRDGKFHCFVKGKWIFGNCATGLCVCL